MRSLEACDFEALQISSNMEQLVMIFYEQKCKTKWDERQGQVVINMRLPEGVEIQPITDEQKEEDAEQISYDNNKPKVR